MIVSDRRRMMLWTALVPAVSACWKTFAFTPAKKNDSAFARELASLADVYVNDAFATAHRAHASTEGVTHFLEQSLAGLLIAREIEMLSRTLDAPDRPFATIVGGAKVSSKIGVLDSLLDRVDVLVIGGAMAFTFLSARGIATGKSLVEPDLLPNYCRDLEEKAKLNGVQIVLPVDVVCAAEIKEGALARIVELDDLGGIPDDLMGLDVGPKTSQAIDEALASCRSILWNGPMGVFETKGFETATYHLVDTLVVLTEVGVTTIVGGGDSVAALTAKGVDDRLLTHISTGGGASLEFIEGRELPGVSCLDDV